MRQRQLVKWDFPMTWHLNDNHHAVAQWDEFAWRSEMPKSSPSTTTSFLFTWPGKKHETLFASLLDGEIYKVDDETTDNISENEVYDIWPQVDKADADEIKQFVDTGSFKKVHVHSISSDTAVIDSVWIRKWKRHPDGSRRVKSRLCARGCFDLLAALVQHRLMSWKCHVPAIAVIHRKCHSKPCSKEKQREPAATRTEFLELKPEVAATSLFHPRIKVAWSYGPPA